MNVNFYVTCIADIAKSNVAKNSVLLLEKLGCNVIFLEKQGCCGQPAINSGYAKEAVAGMKSLVETFEVNDYPIVAPAGSCVYAIKTIQNTLPVSVSLSGQNVLKKWQRVFVT